MPEIQTGQIKPYSSSKPHFKQLLCLNSSQCCRELELLLLLFSLILTELSIFRNFLLHIRGFLIILGTSNLARTSRPYFCLLIHCFRWTYCYTCTKPAAMKNMPGFTALSTSNSTSLLLVSLPTRSIPLAENSSSNFLYVSQKFQGRKGTLKITLCLSGSESVAPLYLWNNRYFKITLIWILLFSLYFDLFL